MFLQRSLLSSVSFGGTALQGWLLGALGSLSSVFAPWHCMHKLLPRGSPLHLSVGQPMASPWGITVVHRSRPALASPHITIQLCSLCSASSFPGSVLCRMCGLCPNYPRAHAEALVRTLRAFGREKKSIIFFLVLQVRMQANSSHSSPSKSEESKLL